jgi:hypothetical protein
MEYSRMPFYVGAISGSGIDASDESGRFLFVDSVDVTYDTKLTRKKKLGRCSVGNTDYVSDQFLDCRIKFDFYFNASLPSGNGSVYDFLNYIPNENNFFPVRIGNNTFKKCFVDDYSVKVEPFKAVKGSATLSCYDPPTSGSISGDSTLPNEYFNDLMNSNQLVYGHTCEVSGVWGDVVSSNVLNSVEYRRRVTKDPSYQLGEESPDSFRVEEIEEEVIVESTGLATFINKNGYDITGNLALFLKDFSGNAVPNYEINLPIGSKLSNETYAIKGGDGLISKATIKNLLV